MDIDAQLDSYREKVNAAIQQWSPSNDTHPKVLHEAMNYSLMNGGKRIRPILLLAAFELHPSEKDPYAAAAAIELLHTYSLIHDDLPCMDDSDLRRGNPTCHKQFDEATALLAGDALLTEAFAILSRAYADDPALANSLVRDLADAAGSQKLIGGQMEDLTRDSEISEEERLNYIHKSKTAALIISAVTMGLRISQANSEKLDLGEKLGYHIGIAFQIIDDILDVSSTEEALGKSTGLDAENGTLTYPKLYGLEASKTKASEHTQTAIGICKSLGGNNMCLIEIIKKLEVRIS